MDEGELMELSFLLGGIHLSPLLAQHCGRACCSLPAAIFPASAMLIEKHEKQLKGKKLMSGMVWNGRRPSTMLRAPPWEALAFLCSPRLLGSSYRAFVPGLCSALPDGFGICVATPQGRD
jgi:hypothetical protein